MLNILADVLVPLTPVILNQMKKGGIYITSGIIDDKEETVVNAVKAAGLEVLRGYTSGRMGVCYGQKKLRSKKCIVFCRTVSGRRNGHSHLWQ